MPEKDMPKKDMPKEKPPKTPAQPVKPAPQPTPQARKPGPQPVKPTPQPVKPTPQPVKPTPQPVKPTPQPAKNKEPYGGDERRKFKRKKADFLVTYLARHPMEVVMRLGDKKVQATMLDLSEEGMAIKSEQDFPLGAELAMGFVLLYAFTPLENIMQDIHIEGVIVNRAALDDKTFRLGIHFTKIKPVDKKALIDFVAHILKR